MAELASLLLAGLAIVALAALMTYWDAKDCGDE